MKINKEKLYELYLQAMDEILEECDWKTHFSAQECVYLVSRVLEQNPELIKNGDS